MRRGLAAIFPIAAATASLWPGIAVAAETKTYTYDALGRLVVVKSTGDVNTNHTRSYCYDKAGNRIEFDANQSGVPATCVVTG